MFLGFVSVSEKRNSKTAGSIKIQGCCPSQITVKKLKNG